MDPNQIRLTSNITISDKDELFFIITDDDIFGYAKNEVDAKFFLEELATQLEADTLKEYGGDKKAKVFRTNVGDKITISYLLLGNVYNSSVYTSHVLEYQKVHQLYKTLTKN